MIGNWRYDKSSGFQRLKAVMKDVRDMSELLKLMDFKVIVMKNKKLADLSKELQVVLQSIQVSPLLVY